MDNVKEDMETRKFHFQRPLTSIQNRIKWRRLAAASSSFRKMMEERKECIDKSKTRYIMVYDLLGLSLYNSDLELGLFMFVSVSSCCSLLFKIITSLCYACLYSAVCIVFFASSLLPID